MYECDTSAGSSLETSGPRTTSSSRASRVVCSGKPESAPPPLPLNRSHPPPPCQTPPTAHPLHHFTHSSGMKSLVSSLYSERENTLRLLCSFNPSFLLEFPPSHHCYSHHSPKFRFELDLCMIEVFLATPLDFQKVYTLGLQILRRPSTH